MLLSRVQSFYSAFFYRTGLLTAGSVLSLLLSTDIAAHKNYDHVHRFEWNTSETDFTEIDSLWQIYPRRFIMPGQFTGEEKHGLYRPPGSWQSSSDINLKDYNTGYVTLRLVTELPEAALNRPLILRFDEIGTSFRLYLNGEFRAHAGMPARNAERTVAGIKKTNIHFQTGQKQIEIVLHIANFDHRRPGLRYLPQIGFADALIQSEKKYVLNDVFLIGAILIIGFYYLAFYMVRKREKSALYFFLFCMAVAVRIFHTSEILVTYFFPGYHYRLFLFFEYASFYIAVPLFGLFLYHLIDGIMPSLIKRWIVATGGSLVLLITVLPPYQMSYTLYVYEIYFVLTALYGTFIITRAALKKVPSARPVLIGWLVLFITAIHDLLYFSGFFQGVPIAAVGVLFFIFAQAFILARHYTRAFNRAELLSSDLDQLVKSRTAELENAIRKAEKLSKMTIRMLVNVSGEIAGPLKAITGMTELLNDSSLTKEQFRHVRIIQNAARTLANMMNGILDRSRIEAGELKLQPKVFDLPEKIDQIVSTFLYRPDRKNIELRYELANNLPIFVIADPDRFTQILSNLLSNAVKYTPSGEIILQVEKDDNIEKPECRLLFTLSDTGIGIDEKELPQLFKTDTSDKYTLFEGRGLGLTVVRELVEMMNGSIRVESRKNIGSTFSFDIFVREAGLNELNVVQREKSFTELPQRDLQILVADDSDDTLFLIRSLLQKMPFELSLAENGSEAFDLFVQKKFDLIMLDLEMPVMNGYHACREIREWEQRNDLPRLPLVAISGTPVSDELLETLKNYGFNGYIEKPFNPERLIKEILKYAN